MAEKTKSNSAYIEKEKNIANIVVLRTEVGLNISRCNDKGLGETRCELMGILYEKIELHRKICR